MIIFQKSKFLAEKISERIRSFPFSILSSSRTVFLLINYN